MIFDLVSDPPLVDLEPDQPPEAEQDEAPLTVHVRTEEPPLVILVGEADKFTDGTGADCTVAVHGPS